MQGVWTLCLQLFWLELFNSEIIDATTTSQTWYIHQIYKSQRETDSEAGVLDDELHHLLDASVVLPADQVYCNSRRNDAYGIESCVIKLVCSERKF